MTIPSCFSASYAQAREAFMAACAAAGVPVRSFTHPRVRGPDGGMLAVDVARLGPSAPDRLTIVSSGTHGIEGYCGSGCQTALLRGGDLDDLPAGAGLVLVHALNPYGFAHMRRVNEDNIDLNRNFVDHAAATYPANDVYDALHPLIAPPDYGARRAHWDAAL